MTKTRFCSLSLSLAMCLCAAHGGARAAAAPAALSVAICDDENEWPPYSYYQRIDGKKTSNVVGFAVDVIHDIFNRHGVNYSVELIPWSRCLAVSSLGRDYAMVFNLSYNAERAKAFLLSRPYYATTSYYYYSRRNHPKGLAINGLADLKKYRVCGVQGYNYDGYGLSAGEVDQGARSFTALISKVKLGRCALFAEKDEVMTGYAAIGKDYLADPDMGKAPIPGMKPDLFYFGVAKRYAHAEQVHAMINAELVQMETNGRLAELWHKATAVKP